MASPAGFEPATCGLEIRCCYPAELRGRAERLLPKIVAAGQRRKGIGPRSGEGGWADHVRLRLYRPIRNCVSSRHDYRSDASRRIGSRERSGAAR
jgi:hypothetical protein